MGDVTSAVSRGDGKGLLKLNERHELMIAYRAVGLTNNEIAERLGCNPSYVSKILSEPLAQEKLGEYRKEIITRTADVGEKIQRAADEALDTVLHWMRERDKDLAAVSARSAFGVLDRAGYSKIEKRIVGHVPLTPEQLQEMQGLARDADKARGEYDYGRDLSDLGDSGES